MKKKRKFLSFIFFAAFVVMLGSVATSAHAHNHDEIKHDHGYGYDHGHDHGLEEFESDHEANEIICCVAGSPKETYFHNYHYKSSSFCDFYRQRITQCLRCGAATPGQLEFVERHPLH